MQSLYDRDKTPPIIPESTIKSIRSKTPQRSDPGQLVNSSNPKLYVVHSHGSSLDRVVPVKVPIVCGVKDSESHLRVIASRTEDALERTVNPSMVDIMKSKIQQVQREYEIIMARKGSSLPPVSLVDKVFEAAMMLPIDGITASVPVKYKIGEQMEDIKLFCRGLSMYDGIYAIDLVTHEIQSVAKVFGLDVIPEANRAPSNPLKILHPPKYHDVLWKEYYDIIALIKHLLTKPEIDQPEYSEYIRRVKTYNNTILAGKGVNKSSRITYSTQGCVSLSGLIQIGIDKVIINPIKDCFIVFACRKHHGEPPPPPPPPIRSTTKSISHSRHEDSSASKRRAVEKVGRGGRPRKLNKKTRRVKMRLNKTKSRKRKI